ncbi:zinc metalloproteinase precursor [Legionella wadsworthii]|uniref:Neutral metalloproteinase n=1 Tax=Legionella wadsworthii TaxID=28088 RepID=A0A378LNA0_9GAMM|nr:M4 family metallopeptidase [Legionella wadsworthii]STY27860.1 zinc metalloproteinase precursor [Legionella wadsworthii]
MLKKLLSLSFVLVTYDASAATDLYLYQAPLSSLNQFSFKQQTHVRAHASAPTAEKNTLQAVNQTQEHAKTIMRYQQLYRGIPVVGAQVMISKEDAQVNGHLLKDIQLNVQPVLDEKKALQLAKESWFKFNPQMPIYQEFSELQIRAGQNDELKLVYQVSFKTTQRDDKPAWPFFIVDAQSGEIIKQWNNIKNYLDTGPGGNEKVQEYWYGKDGLPFLDVTQKGAQCIMEISKVKLVNLGSAWDWNDLMATPFQYPCSKNIEENINGAFSPTNDAYYFGQTIVDMYQDWYGVHALQHTNGSPMQLVMRVHFGQNYDNAFWDGQFMSFGDGNDFYPLVSLDVAGHEVTHGFTEQHSGLEYHDQSGALNESLSDMAGQASRAYLLEKYPQLYARLYLDPNTVTWGIGETIVRDSFGKALRFMDFPSSDGSSADCLDKQLAQSHGAYCAISYPELVAYAKSNISNPQERQSFIVHTASGIFNKAFYLLAKNIGIKQAYQMMIIANSKYWTPTTNFVQGACGVVHAAKDLSVDQNMVKSTFDQVGVSTINCKV